MNSAAIALTVVKLLQPPVPLRYRALVLGNWVETKLFVEVNAGSVQYMYVWSGATPICSPAGCYRFG